MLDAGQGYSEENQDSIKDLRRELHWIEKATFWTQVVLGLIGVVALVIYYRQLGEMKSATLAANKALETANESLWRDKRSWVGVSVAPVPMLMHFLIDGPSQNYNINWYFLIQNFGPGVALNVVEDFETANKNTLNKAFAETCEIAAEHHDKRRDSDIHGGYIMFPGQQIGVPGTEVGNMDQLHSDGALYIVGCILYEDQFGKKHKTNTCLQTLSDMGLSAINQKPQNLLTCESQAN